MVWTPFDASTTDPRSMASPLIQSHPCALEEGLVPRANARIFQPCRASERAVSPPIPPVAPRTRAIRVDSDIPSPFESIIDKLTLPLIDFAVNNRFRSPESPPSSRWEDNQLYASRLAPMMNWPVYLCFAKTSYVIDFVDLFPQSQ